MRLPEFLGPSASSGAPVAPLGFVTLAEIASGDTARIDLCRVTEPEALRNRLVATKRLHAHLLADRELASMFFDEVWMSASLMHPNVVEVVGWGEDREGPYLAVELVEGVSLARLLKTVFDTGEIFGERMVVYMGAQICRGLAAAHELRAPSGEPLGLVHRDLTPGNILIGFEGRVKITDFGLAKAKQRITRTVTGLLKGRPQYMAPEQARGDAVDARADLFSLGVLLFELFSGRRPWSGQTEFEVLSTTQNDPPADLLELRPKIDRELASLVMRLLEKSPEARFESAAEVGIRLDEWLAVHGWSEGNDEALARFVRRNAMRQMRWFERAIKGELPTPRRKGRGGSIPSMPEANPLPSRRERAKRVADEPTEISEAAANAASEHAHHLGEPPPRARGGLDIVDATPFPGRPEDFGEEIPTLVRRDRPLTPGLLVAASVRPPSPVDDRPLPGFELIEEESDQRTTEVQRRVAEAAARSSAADGEAIADPETETLPVKGPRQQAVKDALAAANVGAHGAPRAAASPPLGALPPPTSPLSAGPPRARPPAAPPARGPRPLPPSAAPPRRSAPPPAPTPMGMASGASEALSPEGIVHAAEGIIALATAAEEEARAAAAEASHRAAVARRLVDASEAALRAAAMVRAMGDPQAAAKVLEEAERIVAAVRRGEVDGPAPSSAPSSAPHSPHPALASFGPPMEEELVAPPLGPPLSVPPPEPAPRGSFVSLPPELGIRGEAGSFPPPPSHARPPGGAGLYEASSGGLLRELPRSGGPQDSPTAMALRFRPLILGLPPVVAGALAIFALLAILLVVLVVTD